MHGWEIVIIDPVKNMLSSVAVFLPRMLGALVILLVGWIIAKVLSGLFQKLLDGVKFNTFSAEIGLSDLLSKGGVVLAPVALLGALVYWAVMIIVFAVTVDSMGLTVAAQLLEKIVGYIPNVASAVFVAIVGTFFANLVAGIVKTAATNASLSRAELLASISKGAIVVFTTVLVFEELNIAALFVGVTFQIFFAAICFGLALAFGLGGKDLASKILWDFFNKQNEKK
ncbi:MAG: hypothetical protein HQL19_01195 [Candidatus Omnitrophica bacterium]|nr:hypothetical protein [Candidatus Omnitrophota bacterium]